MFYNVNSIESFEDYDVIMFGASIYGEFIDKFSKEVAKQYPYIEEVDRRQTYGDYRRLGTRLTVTKENSPTISLLYIYAKKTKQKFSLHEDKMVHALKTANKEFKGKKVLAPIIGSGRWGGYRNKEEMLRIIEENTPDLNLYIFDEQFTDNGQKQQE